MISYDYTKTVDSTKLKMEISASLSNLDHIDTVVDTQTVTIWFVDELSDDDKITLDKIVANHDASTPYVDPVLASAVNTLTSYLNSADPNVVAATRAAFVAILAPRLSLETITKINTAVHAKTGA